MKTLSIAIGLTLSLSGLMLPIAAHANPDQSGASLEQFLDESGRLMLPNDFVGSIDPAGFEMMIDADGAPVFVPRGAGSGTPGEWETVGGIVNGCDNRVQAMAYAGMGQLYLGGSFTTCGDVAATRVVRLDLPTGQFHSLGEGEGNGVNNQVNALAVSGADLYVGGAFGEAGGQPANGVARWDGSEWHALGVGEGNGVNNQVSALAVSGADLYVGGWFMEAGGQPANRVARWDGSAWHALGEATGNGVNNQVAALAISDTDLYVGGAFTEAGGQPANRVVRWDGSAWHALGEGSGNGVGGQVNALAVSDSHLYVGGVFTAAGGQPANRVARWDGSAWHAGMDRRGMLWARAAATGWAARLMRWPSQARTCTWAAPSL
jgi:trimeric autotransporter adhesin